VPTAGARLLAAGAALVVAALSLGGCGLGSSADEPRQVSLLVTRDFGARPVLAERAVEVSGNATAATLLADEAGAAGRERGRLYVNGLLADGSPDRTDLHRGDRVWWDVHGGGAATPAPAVVGSFPEPFLHGRDGRRLPVRLECADDAETACDAATRTLDAAGVRVVARSRLGTVGGEKTLRVLVGRWPALRTDFAARPLERGPRTSGVFARPTADGRSIALLDARGRTVRRAGSGTGLVVAVRFSDQEPTWLVTGTDSRGLLQAALALSEDALRGKFAVAVAGDLPTALPVRFRAT